MWGEIAYLRAGGRAFRRRKGALGERFDRKGERRPWRREMKREMNREMNREIAHLGERFDVSALLGDDARLRLDGHTKGARPALCTRLECLHFLGRLVARCLCGRCEGL